MSVELSGKYYAYICKNGKRIAPVSIDPKAFILKKNEFVFFATKPLEIPD